MCTRGGWKRLWSRYWLGSADKSVMKPITVTRVNPCENKRIFMTRVNLSTLPFLFNARPPAIPPSKVAPTCNERGWEWIHVNPYSRRCTKDLESMVKGPFFPRHGLVHEHLVRPEILVIIIRDSLVHWKGSSCNRQGYHWKDINITFSPSVGFTTIHLHEMIKVLTWSVKERKGGSKCERDHEQRRRHQQIYVSLYARLLWAR